MPIYQYRCSECNELTEAIQKVSDAPLLQCPSCGAEALKKLISAVGVIFSGSGFHKNDYTGTTAKKSTPATSTDTTTTTTKTEAAPAAESTAKTETASTPAPSTSSDKPSGGGDGKVA